MYLFFSDTLSIRYWAYEIFFTFYQSIWLIVGEMLEFNIALEKSMHLLHFKLLIFHKNINREGLQLAKRSKLQKLSFTTFPIVYFLQNYRADGL